ncbi:MAG: hypothetical protein JRI68_17090 [Deltaproteobacteria bacterium]|nr:hypothetical protein [Deltaproteobacteria bacterium]
MFRKPVLIVALCLVSVALVFAFLRERRRHDAQGKGPSQAGGQIERCLVCHSGAHEDPGGAHAAVAVGCSSCHLGNPLAFDADRAHTGMEPEPGALATVDRSCGRPDCHQRESARVATSLMATGVGIIAVNRWVFGEVPSPDGAETMTQLLARNELTPAQDHLRKLCAGCHLNARAGNRDDAIRRPGTGCSACHYEAPKDSATAHGSVDAQVSDEACLGCHSRSGRISLSYQGLAELETHQAQDCEQPARLHDGRPACRLEPDIHHERGLKCVDCHLHTDLMGDGTSYAHKEDQVEITCESCHGPHGDRPRSWSSLSDDITRDLLRLRSQPAVPRDPMRVGRRGTPLWNLQQIDREPTGQQLVAKGSGQSHPVTQTPDDPNHELKGHERLTCTACHSRWAPQCSSCHTHYEPGGERWDFGKAAQTPGTWVESADRYDWGEPVLAVRADGRIAPAIPGMILTVQTEPTGKPVRRRLFATIDPHTTRPQARSCASCHRSAAALGWGTGTLQLAQRLDGPATRFEPAVADPEEPARAVDGWTAPFPAQPGLGTRQGMRSLSAPEQRAVLTVGRCLPCHEQSSDGIYADFTTALFELRQGSSSCPAGPELNGR